MKKLTSFFLSPLVGCLLMLLGCIFTSCDDSDQEPVPTFSHLYFSEKGGKQTIEIVSRDNSPLQLPWQFKKLYASNKQRERFPDSTFVYQTEKLPDGSQRITSEWASYTISKDLRFVTIEMAPNPTEKGRGISFSAWARRSGFFIDCYQRGRKSKP